MEWTPEYKKKIKERIAKYKGPKTYTTPEGKRRRHEGIQRLFEIFS